MGRAEKDRQVCLAHLIRQHSCSNAQYANDWSAELYAYIHSVIETGGRRAIDAYEAIGLTLAGKPLAEAAPS
ncbi:hypothetical protein [Methylosinus sp. LW3]|uniref:hypothetical protein n=1 Tax=Methylosinus sp. LW3 TaxID=107635 RepID=UPI000467CF7C|nr:hypothetical protein [Methylosinus sp. LW3]